MVKCPIHHGNLEIYQTTLTKMGKSFDCTVGKCSKCKKLYLNIPFFHHFDEVEVEGHTYLYLEPLARESQRISIQPPPPALTYRQFKPGDIVNLNSNVPTASKNTQKKRNAVISNCPDKLVILQKRSDNTFLVAIAKTCAHKKSIKFETSSGSLYIGTHMLFQIDTDAISHCSKCRFKDQQDKVAQQILYAHSNFQKEEQQRQLEIKKQIKAQKKKQHVYDKSTQRNLEKKYGSMYEIAIMNNDKKTIQKIELLGGSPRSSGKYKTRNGKVLYSSFNPRPSSGGMFTPK